MRGEKKGKSNLPRVTYLTNKGQNQNMGAETLNSDACTSFCTMLYCLSVDLNSQVATC